MTPEEIAALQAENKRLGDELLAFKKPAPIVPPVVKPDPANDPDLKEKARLEQVDKDKKVSDNKSLELAITFNVKAPEFLKNNASLLPQEVAGIFEQANKETFGSAIEKDQAIKSGIVQSFFAIQANVDLLTPAIKSQLDEYLKLTKTGKQDKAQQVYDAIFEPAFEMLKRIKKAEALSKGHGDIGGSEDAYAKRMKALSEKHYLGAARQ